MSSAGHVQDMIQRQRQNRAALTSKKAKFKERKLRNITYAGSGLVIEDMDISKEEMELIKQEIREEARAYKKKKVFKVVIIVAIIALVLGKLVSVVNHYLFFG